MKLLVKGGTTSKLLQVFVQDVTKADGSGLTGLVYNSSGLTAYYYREGAASATSITLATMTVGTWATGGFKEVDATNMPGVYQLGIPDAAIATSANSVVVLLKGATNMAPVVLEVQLVSFDPGDSVRLGLTALPNAAAEAAGGLYTRGTGAGQINQPANGLIDVNTLRWNGTAVATPATAGIPDVNVKNMNNVAATSITTINANQGTTQPINFTGTGASALAKSDMVDVAGAAVSTSTAQLGVNVVNWSGSAVATPNSNGVPIVDRREWVRTNTAQAGASGSITLDASASSTTDFYKGCLVTILSSTGAGQTRLITAYNGSTKVATITPAWATNPTSSSVFALLPEGIADVEAWVAVAPSALISGRVDASVGAYQSGMTPLQPTTAGRTLDVTATGEAGIDWANIGSPTTTVALSGTTVKTATDVETDTQDIQSRLPAALVSGRIDASVGAMASNVVTAAAIADAAIDRATFAADTGLQSARSNTAQAGAAGTITLDASASATTDFYKGLWIVLTGGTGVGQARVCTAYNGTSKVATIAPNWATNPDNTSTFAALFAAGVDVELWGASAPNALQSGRVDSYLGATGAVTLAANVTQFGGTNGTFASGRPEVNTTHVGGTSQTARDLGASVLISPGTGTGQLDVTSGVIKANLAQILGTALTETAGLLAGGFKKFFNVATPTGTVNSIPDAVAGANGGLFIAGSNAATTVNITGNITGNLSGSVGSLTTNNDKTGYSLAASDSLIIQSGTAQAGASTSITLASGASSTTDFYVGALVKIDSSTGAGQTRAITAYNGSTKVATVDRAWATNPTSSSVYTVFAADAAKLDSSLQVTAASVQGNVTGSVGSVTGNVGGNVTGSVGSIATGGIAAASFAAGAIDSAAIATDAIGSAELAASAVTEIQSGLATASALTTAQADLDDIQTRLPAALVSGRMDASVGAYQSGLTPLQPTVAGRTLDVTATGGAGIDWANVENQSTAVDLSATNIDTDQVVASVSGVVGSVTSGVTVTTNNDKTGYRLSATGVDDVWDEVQSGHTTSGTFGKYLDAQVSSIPTGSAPSAATIADAVWDEARTDHTTSGSFGQGAASVQGNVTGSVGSVATGGITASSFASGAIDNAAIATDAIGSAELAASAITEIQSGLSTLDAAGIRTAVGLATANLDTQLTAIDDYLDTEIAAIKAKTDNLPSDPADASDIAASFSTVNGTLTTISGYIDTEVAAIKAKTDLIPATPASTGDAMTLTTGERTSIADALLKRDMSAVTGESARSLLNAIRFLRNKWSISGTTLTVTKEDDTTSAWTATLTTDSNADGVTGSDPA